VAVDPEGWPAILDKDLNVHWKRGGTWTALGGGCARDIAFGGDGSLFKVSCREDMF